MPGIHHPRPGGRSCPMHDLLFLGLGLAGFAALVAYVYFCNRN